MKKRRSPTVADYCIARKGIVGGARVASFIAAWTITHNALGRSITLLEYADWWNEPERTAYRHLREFREVFPHYDSPDAMAKMAVARTEAITRGPKGISALPLSAVAPDLA